MSDETKQQKKGLYLLHIDGGKKASAVGERGEGAIAALLKEPNGTVISSAALSERIGPVESPTAAEYRALLRGLELARERGVNYLAIFSDSRILVNQMNRLWNVGDSLAGGREARRVRPRVGATALQGDTAPTRPVRARRARRDLDG